MRSVFICGLATAALAATAAAAQPHVITKPRWVVKPTGADVGRLYPLAAVRAEVGGTVTVSCSVTVIGMLQNCMVVSESPRGYAFGEMALKMMALFRMDDRDADGRPVAGGVVRMPLVFKVPSDAESVNLATNPAWKTVPTAAALAAAFPKGASEVQAGSAVVRCGVEPDGKMKDCKVLAEAPLRKGFGEAALTLAPAFTAVTVADAPIPFLLADIPFTFRNPAMAQPSARWSPQWVRTLTLSGAGKLYPAPAAAAKVGVGTGVVNCEANAAGELTDCRVESETPAGLGFGAASLEAVKLMTMNAWTAAGEPVEGRRISLPIRMRLEGSAPSPAQP